MPSASTADSLDHDEEPLELITGEAVALDLRPTGFVLRAAGSIIDFIVYLGTYFLLLLGLGYIAEPLGIDQATLTALFVVLLVTAVVVAPTVVETLSHGKSLGRLAVGARIVRDDGGSIGLRHAAIRAFTGVFEIFISLGSIAAVVGLLSGRAKRMGDLVAGTYSQNERVSRYEAPVYGVPAALVPWAATADVARMPDGLSRRVAQFLSQAPSLTPATRHRISGELANQASVFVSPLPAIEPELFLAAVAALRREREFAALQLERGTLDRLAPVLDSLPRGFPDRG